MASTLEGFYLIDKAPGWTSHDVVAKIRSTLKTKRVGHAGTLDPGASGLLIVGIGRATRLLRYFSNSTKEYTGRVVFGVSTDTLDNLGRPNCSGSIEGLSIETIKHGIARFIGDIDQIPPMVSAKKINGTKLYTLARQGIEIERQPVRVRVDRFELDGPLSHESVEIDGRTFNVASLPIAVTCSAGTFVRSLAHDLGRVVGFESHLRDLRRTKVGCLDVDQAIDVTKVAQDNLRPVNLVSCVLDQVQVDAEIEVEILNGVRLSPGTLERLPNYRPGPYAVVGSAGNLLGVYRSTDTHEVPEVILN